MYRIICSGCLGEEMQQCPGLILGRLAHAKQPGRVTSPKRMEQKVCRPGAMASRRAAAGYFACKTTGGGGGVENLKRMGMGYGGKGSKITAVSQEYGSMGW
jgi:hypothetical protein